MFFYQVERKVRLALLLSVIFLLGFGCNSELSSTPIGSSESFGEVVIPDKASASKKDLHISSSSHLRSPEMIKMLSQALDSNPDFTLLRKYYVSQGFSYTPSSTNYVTASDSSGSLVAFSYRGYLEDRSAYAALNSVYSFDTATGVFVPVYDFISKLNLSNGGGGTLIWASNTKVCVLELNAGSKNINERTVVCK